MIFAKKQMTKEHKDSFQTKTNQTQNHEMSKIANEKRIPCSRDGGVGPGVEEEEDDLLLSIFSEE